MAFCLFVCFTNLPLCASKSKHGSCQAVPPSPKGTLVNVPKPVTASVLQQGLHSDRTSSKPEAACPRTRPARPCQAFPTTMPKLWSCPSPTGLPAGCLIPSGSVHASPCSCLHWPHQSKLSSISRAWAGGRRAVASSAGHTELQGPLAPSRLAPHHGSEFGSVLLPPPQAAEPFSLACVSPNSLERASKNAQ